MYCRRAAGQDRDLRQLVNPLKNLEKLKHFGVTVANYNCIHEDAVVSWNASCHVVHNRLSFRLLSKNANINIYKMLVVTYETKRPLERPGNVFLNRIKEIA
jgi:hypothetical protein